MRERERWVEDKGERQTERERERQRERERERERRQLCNFDIIAHR